MSVFALATGTLIADPVRRSGAKSDFATATVRCHTEGGEHVLVSVIAFGDASQELLAHRQGGAVAVAGRATLRTWTGKNGETKFGLSVVCEQVASASSARRADSNRRRARAA